jgi:16S rRNA (guanine527-N7)-methyltransferase
MVTRRESGAMRAIEGPPLARLGSGAAVVLGRELTQDELTALDGYVGLLLSWQRRYRLVGSADVGWIVDELLLDSLLFARFVPVPAASVLDLGSGAGIPGVPLKIVLPRLRLALLEARRRRTSFLATVVRTLGLQEVRVIGSQAETALREHPDLGRSFQVVVSRAAGDPEAIAKLARPFVEAGGSIVVAGPPLVGRGPASPPWISVEHPTKRVQRSFLVTRVT